MDIKKFYEYDADDAALDAETQAEIEAELIEEKKEKDEPKVNLDSTEERKWRASLGLNW